MIKRLKSPKNRLKIDFNPDLVVVCSEKVGTFDDIHLFLGIYIPVDTMYYSPCRGRRWSCGVPEKSLIFGVLWNVVGSKLLMLLIFIFSCREQCWRRGIVVCVVVNIINLVVVSTYIVPFI